MSSKVDVLIIGAGPTGLMAALWMAQLGIQTRIIDKRGTRVLNGHADGFQARTMEILDSFGVADAVNKRSASSLDWCAWAPNEEGGIHRIRREPAFGSDVARFQAVTLHQGYTEAYLLDAIKQRSGIEVERGIEPESLQVDESQKDESDAYPITIDLHHLEKEEIELSTTNAHSIKEDGTIIQERGFGATERGPNDADELVYRSNGKEGQRETVRAKYVLACEGAHSWTRRQLGFIHEGESTDELWAVIDVIPITDFPDIRKLCTIQSNAGTILNVPREDWLTRLYIQLPAMEAGGNANAITPERMFVEANKILAPYTLRYTYCDWWTIYRVGQRVSNHYTLHERVFLAGDAVHSHTPKGGQGMNVSIQDAFNLGWKLGGVLKGQLSRSVLKTYEAERRPVAQQLIALDRTLSRLLSGKPDLEELDRVYALARKFLSGVYVHYPPSALVAEVASEQQQDWQLPNGSHEAKVLAKANLATNVTLGERFPSHQVILQSDECRWETQAFLKSDGRWRLIVFGGDVSNKIQLNRVNTLGEDLAVSPDGVLTRYVSADPSIIQVYLVHCAPRTAQIELSDFHKTFFPFDERLGHDYSRVFMDLSPSTAATEVAGDAHRFYGVDPAKGCMVVTRPDQVVGYIGEMGDVEGLKGYFDGFLMAKEGV